MSYYNIEDSLGNFGFDGADESETGTKELMGNRVVSNGAVQLRQYPFSTYVATPYLATTMSTGGIPQRTTSSVERFQNDSSDFKGNASSLAAPFPPPSAAGNYLPSFVEYASVPDATYFSEESQPQHSMLLHDSFPESEYSTTISTPASSSGEPSSVIMRQDLEHENRKRARDSLGMTNSTNKSLRLTPSPASSTFGQPRSENLQSANCHSGRGYGTPMHDFEFAQRLETQQRRIELEQQSQDYAYAQFLQEQENRQARISDDSPAAGTSPDLFKHIARSDKASPSASANYSALGRTFQGPHERGSVAFPRTLSHNAPSRSNLNYRPPILLDSESDAEQPYRRGYQASGGPSLSTGRFASNARVSRPQSSSSHSIIDLTASSPEEASFPPMPGSWTVDCPSYTPGVLTYGSGVSSTYKPALLKNTHTSYFNADPSMSHPFLAQIGRSVSGIAQGFKASYESWTGNNNSSLNQPPMADHSFGGPLGTLPIHNFDRVAPSSDESSQHGTESDQNYAEDYDAQSAEQFQTLMDNDSMANKEEAEERLAAPSDLTPEIKLFPHQQAALTWMVRREQSPDKGGILADAMGLGKTVETISLLLHARREYPPRAGNLKKINLIVGPVAVLNQWASEIESKVKEDQRVRTYIYQNKRKETWETLKRFDVVITSYGVVASEYKNKINPAGTRRQPVLFDDNASFWRIILDEAHCIKNRKTQCSKACLALQATYRWCLTGTPMQNSVVEIYPALAFLRIHPYNNWSKFSSDIANRMRGRDLQSKTQALKKLHDVLKEVLLRRTKSSIVDGKVILDLPDREILTHHANFDQDQAEFYDAVEKKARAKFNKYINAGDINNHVKNVINLLLRMRQAACHPHLLNDFRDERIAGIAPKELLQIAEECLSPAAISQILNEIAELGIPICPLCEEQPMSRIFTPCGHGTCPECFMSWTESEARQNSDDVVICKCHICNGDVNPTKITDMISFKIAHLPGYKHDGESSDAGDSGTQDSSHEDDTDLDGFVVKDEEEEEEEEEVQNTINLSGEDADASDLSDLPDINMANQRQGAFLDLAGASVDGVQNMVREQHRTTGPRQDQIRLNGTDDSHRAAASVDTECPRAFARPKSRTTGVEDRNLSVASNQNSFRKSKFSSVSTTEDSEQEDKRATPDRGGSNGMNLWKRKKRWEKKARKTLSDLKKEANRSDKDKKKYLDRLEKDFVTSAKTDKCMEILRNIMNRQGDDKIIVFSQWTTMLDLLEVPISLSGWGWCRYDGSMIPASRTATLAAFKDRPDLRIILISLKAGNAGLNLTTANHVVLFDPFWNPYIEDQAIDRAHRIGQCKMVHVHRIIVPNTVEDRMLQIQERKRGEVDSALDGGEVTRLTGADVEYLFNGPAH